jgi:hypothetical protein
MLNHRTASLSWIRGFFGRRYRLATVPIVVMLALSSFLAYALPNDARAVGPVSAFNYPVWYKDGLGQKLELCLEPNNPLCIIGDVPDPAADLRIPDNFPDESFYWNGGATIDFANANGSGKALLVLGLEAAFGGTGSVVDGQQIVFGRVRFKIVGGIKACETYTFRYPYGNIAIVADEAVRGAGCGSAGKIFYTDDVGIGNPLDFTGALDSQPIQSFLRWPSGAPAGYLGDPAILHTVTGSPIGQNFFQIDGTDIGGPGVNSIRTDQFTIMGKLATNSGVNAEAAVYTRSGSTGGTIDIYANSEFFQSIQIPADASAGYYTTLMDEDTGHYFTRLSYTGALPSLVTVVNSGDNPPTKKTIKPTDRVVITQATLNTSVSPHVLTVKATSSDTSSSAPTLTLAGYNIPLTGGTATVETNAPLLKVTVTSSAGGSDTANVEVSGAANDPMAVNANAGLDQNLQSGAQFTLDGSASYPAENITSYIWKDGNGNTVSASKQVTISAPANTGTTPTVLQYTLTVTGVGSSQSSSTVRISVLPQNIAATANAGPDQQAQVGSTVTLDGSLSQNASSYSWAQVSGPAVSLSNASAVKPTFTFGPVVPSPTPAVLVFELTVQPGGAKDRVQINALSDTPVVQTSAVRINNKELRITGTAPQFNPAGDVVTICRYSSTNTPIACGQPGSGATIGSSPVDATGAWDVRIRNMTAAQLAAYGAVGTNTPIVVVTSRGGYTTNIVTVAR